MRKLTRVPKNTRAVNDWTVRVWRDWATWRNKQMGKKNQSHAKYKEVPYIDEVIIENEELGYWLSRFVLEIRGKDKKPYPLTLYGIFVVVFSDI